jgi:hypothetical protein
MNFGAGTSVAIIGNFLNQQLTAGSNITNPTSFDL